MAIKILIIGATGLLGSRYFHILSKYYDVSGTYFNHPNEGLNYLSITDKRSIDKLIFESKPDVVIHTAGVTNPDECEKNKRKAYEVNVGGTKYIVDACKRNKSLLVFLSTSHIFSGGRISQDQEPDPINYYGQTKLMAERYIQQNLRNFIILRPTKLYGFYENGEDFTKKIINLINQKKRLLLDNRIKYFPVLTDDIVEITKQLIERKSYGIYNISTDKGYTKYEWAQLIIKKFNLRNNKLQPITEKKIAKRPLELYFLPSQKFLKMGIEITPLEEGIDHVKKQMGCTFNLIYSFRPDRLIKGKSASILRINLGKALAREDIKKIRKVDLVVPIPESGIYSAQGYAHELGLPLYHAIIRDYETDKTLWTPKVEKRVEKIRKRLIVIEDVVKRKKIVLIDEAIISGLTMQEVIKKLKIAGVKEIHIRIPAPIMFFNCNYNILSKNAKLLVSNLRRYNKSIIEKRLARYFRVKSVRFLRLSSFIRTIDRKEELCYECFCCLSKKYDKKK